MRFSPSGTLVRLLPLLAALSACASGNGEQVPVGVAQVDITPDYPVRLSGFGFRRAESEGITQRIWAKALAFGDEGEGPAILITTDNLGVSEEIADEVARRLARATGLKRHRLAVTATHTHTAPMLTGIVPTLFGVAIPPEHQRNIDRYTREFVDKLEAVALAAVKDIRPGRVEWAIGEIGFAANRRTKGGPVDHDLPVLIVRDDQNQPRAVYFSYACHCVTLSHNHVSGDWAGYAVEAVQEHFPGAIALASVGCGADSNPSSGVTGDKVEIAADQGGQIAREVKRMADGAWTAIAQGPVTRWQTIDLPLAAPRTRTEWEERAARQDAVGYHARVNLERLDRGETLPEKIVYPIQTWAFGDALAMVFLPGEVVVDYSLRLKREFDRQRLWVNAYANDAPCYIPSERVLREGGYEGGDAMIYYDQPQRFAPGLEQKIIDVIGAQLPEAYRAQPGTEGSAPRSPQSSLESIRVKPGLEVELVAAEPHISSPVAIDWGPDGRLWVCEMYDYPMGLDGSWQPGGRVRFLQDTNGDGSYDRSVVFLDKVPFPTGVMAWGAGVLICAAPDILLAEDSDGDGRGDRVAKVLTGFSTENYQARVNSLSLGLDNWIYAANGLLGGVIGHHPLNIRGHDFRFRVRADGPVELVSGLTQQGRVRDDWGNWFGCDNGNAVFAYPHEFRYFRRNPHVAAPPAAVSPLADFDAGRVYPVSRLLERFNDFDQANRLTSACGLGLYRDDWLGAEFYGNTFTCEPVHNLVHRLILEQDGHRRRRAADEQQSEFLASTDNWFRPVQARTGPDGALYIVDMYRFLVEHPRWIPPARLAQIDVRAGSERGRIYRVRAAGKELRPVPDLTRLEGAGLAEALDSSNGTERDRVHLELLRRGGAESVERLSHLARTSSLAQTRMQALSVLAGLDRLSVETLTEALQDPDDRVRRHAVRLSEETAKDLSAARLAMVRDASPRVREQLALTLGESAEGRAGEALAELATNHPSDAALRQAILSSAGRHGLRIVEALLKARLEDEIRARWLEPLIATVAGAGDVQQIEAAFRLVLTDTALPDSAKFQAATALLSGLDRRGSTWVDYSRDHPQVRDLNPLLENLFAAARIEASKASGPGSESAIRLLGSSSSGPGTASALWELLKAGARPSTKSAVLAALRQHRGPDTARLLLADWAALTPGARGDVIALLLERDEWIAVLLEAIQEGRVGPAEISLMDRRRLLESGNDRVRRVAAAVWAQGGAGRRSEVIERYHAALGLAGQAGRGAELFAQHCASCHALGRLGHAVGPDLEPLRGKAADYWLQSILDPNSVVEPRFVSYEASTRDDRIVSGIIKDETATTLTLAAGNGVQEQVLKSDLRELRALALSLMPEGLEEGLPPQAMADLLAFLRRPMPAKRFPGNAPAVLKAGPDGVLMLPAANAEIYGGDIALEPEFGNIGLWHGADDHVIWTVEVPANGLYRLHLDYACADGSAGNTFVARVGGQSIVHRVTGTGPDWSRYRQVDLGSLTLEAGEHRLVFAPEGSLRNALLDLRTLALAPPNTTPRWPSPAPPPDGLLRDPVAIARYLLDASQPREAREAAIAANPQFAARFVEEMARDIRSENEYERIPWIWRVAVACGKRNETAQLRELLVASLPGINEPLRDWQAVVIGGGIINGLSQRGHWPGERIDELLGNDPDTIQRWKRALELAAIMAEDERVPTGTRYDALRMLGLDSWAKRGVQLRGYLATGTNSELQMGAVSGLGDMRAIEAGQALVEALDGLTPGNRDLALLALTRDDHRAALLASPSLSPATRDQLAKLADSNATVRERVQSLLKK